MSVTPSSTSPLCCLSSLAARWRWLMVVGPMAFWVATAYATEDGLCGAGAQRAPPGDNSSVPSGSTPPVEKQRVLVSAQDFPESTVCQDGWKAGTIPKEGRLVLFATQGVHQITLITSNKLEITMPVEVRARPMAVRFNPDETGFVQPVPRFALRIDAPNLASFYRKQLWEAAKGANPDRLELNEGFDEMDSVPVADMTDLLDVGLCKNHAYAKWQYALLLRAITKGKAASRGSEDRQDYSLSGDLIDTAVGQASSHQQAECPSCTPSEVSDRLRTILIELLQSDQKKAHGCLTLGLLPPETHIQVWTLTAANEGGGTAGRGNLLVDIPPLDGRVDRGLFGGIYRLTWQRPGYYDGGMLVTIPLKDPLNLIWKELPPPPRPPTDVCPNLQGLQEQVPKGMVRNKSGSCVVPPPPVPAYKKWWFWQSLSAVAVIAVGGVVAGVYANPGASR